MLKRLRMAVRGLVERTAADRELDEELRFHLEREAELYIARGMAPAEARRRARVALGGVEPTKEIYRDGRGTRAIEEIGADLKYAFRALRRDKPLAIAGILTLALGIGATTAVFSAVNAVMLRDLPFGNSSELVALWEENKARGWYKNVVAPANYLDWSEQATTFTGMAAYTDYGTNVTLLGQGEPRLLSATSVTGNFLSVLRVVPALGRGFEDADTWDDGQRPAIISHRLWQSQFGGDSSIIGRLVSLGGASRWQIVGVMPAGFSFPLPATDVWLPTLFAREGRTAVSFRRAHWLRVVGRMKPGVTPERALADLQVVIRKLQTEYPATNAQMGGGLTPIREWIVGDAGRPLVILLAASTVLLLIACVNVGNLLLVHAVGRAREMSLRFALGASRPRVVRLAIAQSLLLSSLGGAIGVALGWIGARALIAMQPQGLLPITEIPLDHRVWIFALALATVSGIVFGVAPALLATRQAPADALGAGSRSVAGGGARRWARHLVVGEVALASLLLVGASLLVRSYRNVAALPPGFSADDVLTAGVAIPASRYDSASRVIAFYHTLLARVAAQPGVDKVAGVRQLPTAGPSWSSSMAVRGRPPMPEGADVLHREVLGDYFGVMRVPVLRGRTFTPADGPEAGPVVVINDALARLYFPGENPIGRQIAFDRVPDSASVWRTIVGVVGDERQASLTEPPVPEIFAPFEQDESRQVMLVVRAETGRDPVSLAGGVRRSVRDLDSLLALTSLRPMTEVHSSAMSRQRFMSVLVFVFAGSGLLLAIVGVFGVLTQVVQSRSREMGLRIALGADPGQVGWLIVKHGLRLVIPGIVCGLAIAAGATRVLTSLLYGVGPMDPLSYVVSTVILVGLGATAAAIPATRASLSNPAVTLRAD
ncbi:MAG TPA: ABC transporter permease [Gemmatimonadaceae bacterium]|nr:ABC transporter permease [Gemmatimonadaceae bacterium]